MWRGCWLTCMPKLAHPLTTLTIHILYSKTFRNIKVKTSPPIHIPTNNPRGILYSVPPSSFHLSIFKHSLALHQFHWCFLCSWRNTPTIKTCCGWDQILFERFFCLIGLDQIPWLQSQVSFRHLDLPCQHPWVFDGSLALSPDLFCSILGRALYFSSQKLYLVELLLTQYIG